MSRRQRCATVRRPGRDGSRGQAIAIVGLGAVSLFAITGLAVDGGNTAAKFREAQNAADSGALAAARYYWRETIPPVSNPVPCFTTTGQTPKDAAECEIGHNEAQPTVNINPITITTYGPSKTGFTSDAALASLSSASQVSVVSGLQTLTGAVTGTLEVGGSHGTTQANLPPSVASGSVNLGAVSTGVTLTADGGALAGTGAGSGSLYQCSSQAQSNVTPTTSTGTACPTGSLTSGTAVSITPVVGGVPLAAVSVDTAAALGLSGTTPNSVLKQVTYSDAGNADDPKVINANQVSTLSRTVQGAVGIAIQGAATGSRVGQPVGGSNQVVSSLRIANGTIDIGTTSIALSGITERTVLKVSPGSTPTISVSTRCTQTTFNVSSDLGTASVTIDAACHVGSVTLPRGVTLSGPATSTTGCTAGSTTCSVTFCLLQLSVPATEVKRIAPLVNATAPTTVCIGKSNASMDTAALTQTEGWSVQAHIPLTTYLLRVAGVLGADPTAQAQAKVLQVSDATPPSVAAQYAVSDFGTPTGGCTALYGPLQVGCEYQVYGPNVDPNSAMSAQTSNWQGWLDQATAHAQGTAVTPRNGGGIGASGPAAYVGSYWLLPVIDTVAGYVQYYGVFQPTGAGKATLVSNVRLVQAQTTTSWMADDPGATAVKLSG